MESDWVYCHFRQKKDSLNNFKNSFSISKDAKLAGSELNFFVETP